MIIIYVLEKNNVPFYVGKCNNINVRFCQHKKTYGLDINIKVLELVDDKEWKDKERYYILLHESKGFKLENKNKGGGGPTNLNDISRQKITDSKTGNHYKLKNIPEGEIEKLYEYNNIQQISELLNLTFPTVKKYLINKNIYIKYKNKPSINEETKRNFKNRKHRDGKPIIQLDKNNNIINDFNSISEACIYLNKPKREGDITAACQGKQKTAFGYKWKYKEK
jgi:hypothetical protein